MMQALEKIPRPLGVFKCIKAGFDVVSRNLWLIVLPLAIDVFLWLGPRLSIAPLLDQTVGLLQMQSLYDPAVMDQAVEMLEAVGEQFNMFSFLSLLPLLHVPTLLSYRGVGGATLLGERMVMPVSNGLQFLAWLGLLVIGGLGPGFLYLNSMARGIRTSEGEKPQPFGDLIGETVGSFVRFLVFCFGVIVLGLIGFLIVGFFVGRIVAWNPVVADLVFLIMLSVGGYIAVHFMFVVHGLLLGRQGLIQSTLESIILTQFQFPSTAGLVMLIAVIRMAFSYIWTLSPGNSWIMGIGVLANAGIVTALIAATFVFYKDRTRWLAEVKQLQLSRREHGTEETE